jgi:hypothetical protein
MRTATADPSRLRLLFLFETLPQMHLESLAVNGVVAEASPASPSKAVRLYLVLRCGGRRTLSRQVDS